MGECKARARCCLLPLPDPHLHGTPTIDISVRWLRPHREICLEYDDHRACLGTLDCYRVATKHSYLLKKVHAWGRLASLCLLEICK